MKRIASRTGALLATAAALSLVASPAMAQRWGGGGYGGGWGHRDRGDDTGAWVVGGIIGIGMIAAIASAASKSKRERDARQGDYRNDDYYRGDSYRGDNRGYSDRREEPRSAYAGSGRGIDGAVDRCVSEIERGSTRVDTVDAVNRDANGWRVAGRTSSGQPFDCVIDNEGRIRGVSLDGRAPL